MVFIPPMSFSTSWLANVSPHHQPSRTARPKSLCRTEDGPGRLPAGHAIEDILEMGEGLDVVELGGGDERTGASHSGV